MIYDSLNNFGLYLCMHPQFTDVLSFLQNHEPPLSALPPATYTINSSGAFALVSDYMSKPESEGFLEYHRKFIDIQILIEGRERIGVAHRDNCVEQSYLEEKDFGKLDGTVDYIMMNTHNFAIFFPQDAHMPQISCEDRSERVKKVVFKIPVQPPSGR